MLILQILSALETMHQLHAQEIAYSLDISKYDGIVCVSGDGVLAEVSNLIFTMHIGFEMVHLISWLDFWVHESASKKPLTF